MRYVTSSFSLQMVAEGAVIHIEPHQDFDQARWTGERVRFVIGHEGTAKALEAQLNPQYLNEGSKGVVVDSNPFRNPRYIYSIPVSRDRITLQPGDVMLVCQPSGERLTVGAEVSAPELKYFKVTVYDAISKVVSRDWYLSADKALAEKYSS